MKRFSTRTLNLLGDLLGLLFVLVAIYGIATWFIGRPAFWLRGLEVRIEGNQDAVTADEVAGILKEKFSGTFFTADIRSAALLLKKHLPWIKDVDIRRSWPNELNLTLTLHTPIAVWQEEKLLSNDGTIFVGNREVAEAAGNLPNISGPEERRMEIYERYQTLAKLCRRLKVEPVSLDFSDLSGWTLKFKREDGRVISVKFRASDSPAEMEAKFRRIINNFSAISKKIGGEPLEIDARYSKEVSVVRPEPEEEKTEPGEEVPGETKDGR